MSGKRVWWCVLQERQVQSEAHDALLDVAMHAQHHGCIRLTQPYTRTDLARNQIAARFMRESSRPDDTLVMLDNDHEHPADVIPRLARANAPVVGALAFLRGQPFNACAFVQGEDGLFHPIEPPVEPGLYAVDVLGHAAVAIQRRVFVELQRQGKLYPWWRYEYTEFRLLREDGTAKAGLAPNLPSEDMYFSRICREAGIQLYLDTALQCPHLITGRVTAQTFLDYRDSLPAEEREQLQAEPVAPEREPAVDLVVPGWGNFHLTRQLLESLKQTLGARYHVIYVDDGSPERDELAALERDYPAVQVIRLPENRGFIQATNAGLQAALERPGDFLMWLNNDVVIPEGAGDWLVKLLEPFNYPDVAATGAVTDNVSAFQRRPEASAAEPPECWLETPILIGFALALRKSAVREVGLLDERFGIGNFEDWDYSLRLAEAGYRLVVCENVWLRHAMHQTFQKLDVDFAALLEQNLRQLAEKWGAKKLTQFGVNLQVGGGARAVRLLTHSTAGWLDRIAPYLASLERYSPFENWLLTVNCSANGYGEAYPHLKLAEVPRVPGAPEVTESLQHGGFLPYVPGAADDILVYTDGDIVMQRAPTAEERELLETLPADMVAAGWNSGPHETLALEATRLGPRVADLGTVFDGTIVARAGCYNIGVIAARRATWERIHAAYMELYPLAEQAFARQQRQQWLVCYVIAALGLKIGVLPYTFHMHGCYALPEGGELVDGVARYRGEPVLFRHHL